MTIQDMKTCLSNTYEIRRTDLILPYEEKKRLLEGKYPTKDLLGNRAISSRMHPVLDTFMAHSLDEDYLDATQLRQFSDQLYLEHGLFQEDTMEMREIIEVLRIHLKAGCRYSAETVERLFDYAFDLYLDDPEFYPGPNGTEPLDRQIQAAKRLRRYISQDWMVQYGQIYMDQSIMEQLQEELDRRISHIGGVAVLRALLQSEFYPNYDRQMDRFMILRPKRSGSGGRNFMTLPKAAVPVNYLIQIALKHVTPLAGPYRTQVADIRTIKEIARDMMTVLRLSDAESMSDILVPPEQLPNYIQDNAQYDSMCIPFQYDPGFCTWVVEKFYLPFAQKAGLVSIKRTYLPVLRWCLRQQSLYFFKAEDIQHEIGLGLKQVKSVLDICSQAAEDVNRDFRSLADDMTAQNYPLIRLPDGSYFQLDPHLSGYAFCECIYRQIKGRVRNFDRNLGVSLELLIKNKLTERKIPFSCGHYTDMEGKDRDCDLILEGTDIILFMEIKKRPLPGKFQQGDSLEIFSALADGMVYGQVQALRHRAMLERSGTLTLYTDSTHETPCASIFLNGRRIYTVSVCLPEYSFFTTAVIAQKILYLLKGRISTTNPAQKHKLDKFNKLASEFRAIVSCSDGTEFQAVLHDSVFRSLHQLWTVLKLCADRDVNRFIRLLVCDCTIATYNLDFYHSLRCALEYDSASKSKG